MSLFLCFSGISLVRYCQKSLARSGGFRKKITGGGGGGGMTIQGVVYRRGGLKPSVHYVGILSSLQSSDIRRKLRRGYFQFPDFWSNPL